MRRYVLDASVAIKLYVPEVHSDLAAGSSRMATN
jgi:predicted nucleic acid-binding protein